jgi:hypothetical protein
MHLAPVLLGAGAPLSTISRARRSGSSATRVVEASGVTLLTYRVAK